MKFFSIKRFPRLRSALVWFGVRLARLGRRFQYRYGQNDQALEIEFFDYCGSDLGRFNLSRQIADVDMPTIYKFPQHRREEMPEFVKCIFRIDGVDFVSVSRYQVEVGKHSLVSWEDVKPKVEQILREEFAA